METLLTAENQKEDKRTGVKEQKILNGIEAQTAVFKAGAEFWKATKDWGDKKQLLTSTDASILEVAASIPDKIPTEKQSMRCMDILVRLDAEGYQYDSAMLA
jgi:hypothetical protein